MSVRSFSSKITIAVINFVIEAIWRFVLLFFSKRISPVFTSIDIDEYASIIGATKASLFTGIGLTESKELKSSLCMLTDALSTI